METSEHKKTAILGRDFVKMLSEVMGFDFDITRRVIIHADVTEIVTVEIIQFGFYKTELDTAVKQAFEQAKHQEEIEVREQEWQQEIKAKGKPD